LSMVIGNIIRYTEFTQESYIKKADKDSFVMVGREYKSIEI